MTSLFTQCPHCQTSFRVSNAQLNAAHGLVRCGSCLGVFSASANEIRVKHPDGYIVEELEDADELVEDHEPEVAPEFADAEGFADGVEFAHEEEPQAALTADFQADDSEESADAEFPAPVGPEDDDAMWHRPGEPHFDLGDLSLDELENDEEEAHAPEAAEAIVEEYANEAFEDADEFDAESDDECHDEFDEEFGEEFDAESPDDFAESFTAERDEPESEIPAPAARLANLPHEKQAVREKLGTLSFDDALEPVSEHDLEALEAVPVTLLHSASFRSRAVTALLLLANVVLLLALPLPWLYTHRNELATHPRFSFLAEPVCRYLACEPPPPAIPATLYSQQLLVRSHPKAPDALEVSFVFHNDGKQPQDFPKLALDFSDINNHVLANRLFTPQEYLPPELRHLRQMPAQSTVQIQLELSDPGKEAVNYKVELYPL